MNGNTRSRKLLNSDRDSVSDLDDGFFSDVPISGSLSRSQLALNKFMKKNLLYEENTYENDGAYFSKESTPNESVTKYDSDSVKSNESSDRVTTTEQSKTRIKETYIGVDLNVSVPHNESVTELNSATTEAQVPYKSNTTEPLKETSNKISNVTEQTDDYKYKQLRDNSNSNTLKKSVVRIEYVDVRNEPTLLQPEHRSVSLDDISNDYGTAIDEEDCKHSESVIMREKPRDGKIEEKRHTVHDSSDWVNRTNIYPDVYAPLPYKSPRRYVESDVNIHYRCPVRHDPLPLVPEKELARQQAEHMKRLYREQRRNKYLQELQDMQNRRHQDNFTPSQKNILPLNRYDEAERVIAKALYTFNGQTPRELSFRKGDIIHVRKQIDSNWYEGEIHGRVGLFPYNYVEIQKGDSVQTPKKPVIVEGRARAKFDFTAQTNLELPLKKGEVVVLTRKIDQNWWEGRNGNKTGIFPDSYVTILQEPSQNKPEIQRLYNSNSEKPVASPAAHGLMNGSAKRSMGAHSYTPQQNSQALSNAPPATQPLPGYAIRQSQSMLTPSERGYGPPTGAGVDLNNSEPLYVDTNAEAVPYRAMYKYRPQNPDELELSEGDTVYVLEKCDDGWYVGSSQRTGRFGTFPGNYVERI